MADANEKLLEQIQKQQEQINALSKQVEENQRDMMYAMSRRPQNTAGPHPATRNAGAAGGGGPQLPELDLSGLPDPSLDAAAYNRGLADRLKKYQEDMTKAAQAQAQLQEPEDTGPSSEERAAALWEDFQERHPQHAKSKAIVGTAAAQVMERARMRGVDPDTFMYGNTNLFFDEVAKQVDKNLKDAGYAPVPSEGGDEGEDGGEITMNDLEGMGYEEYANLRTKGVLGASSAGGTTPTKGARKKGKKQEEPSAEDAFAAEMAEIQKKGGYL